MKSVTLLSKAGKWYLVNEKFVVR